jgi:two-component system, NtrC family, sensor histidine kinase HydH
MKNNNYPKIIAVISFLMIIVLGVFGYMNYNREREFMKDHLLSEGLALSRILESSVTNNVVNNINELQLLIETGIKDTLNEMIIFLNDSGQIVAHTNPGMVGEQLNSFYSYDKKGIKTEIIKSGSNNVFQFIQPFLLKNKQNPLKEENNTNIFGESEKNLSIEDAGQLYVIIRFNANEYLNAESEDLRRAIGTAVLLLLLSIASVYFVFVINRHHSLNVSLQTMTNYISRVVDNMPNGLISLDKDGKVKTINKNAISLLGLYDEKVKGKSLADLLPNCNTVKTLAPPMDIYNEQINCRLNDGQVVPISITSSKLTDENENAIGTVIMLSDLREVKLLEKKIERSERLASLGRMAAGIAHEIRNPLSSIKGFAQYFRNKFKQDSEDWNYAGVIAEEVDRLNRVIQEMLNFAKPQQPNFQSHSIEQLVEHTLTLIQPDIQEKKINVIKKLDGNLPQVRLDGDLITQALLNLFLNASDAMKSGGKLTIETELKDNILGINIIDTGSGVPTENLSNIFDPFFTLKKGGTGLGLAIVYRIIEIHDGEIEVFSEPGKGTTFKIKLPVRN